MGRPSEGWKLRAPRQGGRTWSVRFTTGGKSYELGTGETDRSAAMRVAERIYREHGGYVPATDPPAMKVRPKMRGAYAIQGAGRYIKIGWATDVYKRIGALQTSHPERLRVIGFFPGGREIERELHLRLKKHRALGEWFYPTPEVLSVVACAWPCEPADGAGCAGLPRRGAAAR